MVQNRAAQELANLAQGISDFEDEAANQAAIATEQGTRGADAAGQDQEAGFALPEALATSVVGSFIFGPVGGLLLGAAQGWLGKQERQNILDQQAGKNKAISGAEDVLRGQFDRLMSGDNVSPEDAELLDTLKTQQDTAFKMMKAGDPSLAQDGMALLKTVQSELTQFSKDQEQQRINQEVRNDELAQRLDDRQRGEYLKLLDDFDAQSGNYQATMRTGDEILSLLESGNPFDLNAALTNMAKLMDPASAAMEGEVNAWRNLGNLIERAQGIVGKAADGRPLTASQARDLQDTVLTIIDGREQLQVSREMMFQKRLNTLEIPRKYWNDFKLTENVPAVNKREIQWESFTDEAQRNGKTLAESLEVGIDAGEDVYRKAFENGREAKQWFDEQGLNPFKVPDEQREAWERYQRENIK